MRGMEAIARILQAEGVEVLFLYPNHSLVEAAAALGIRPIIARTEKTLLNMTDGYSRATNGQRLGVCAVQAGPGIENAFGGIAQAYADSIPILLLPGGPDQRRLGIGAEFDPIVNYAHITKWAARINFPERIPELLRRGFTLLRNGKPGPVMLEIPRDVGGAEVDEAAIAAYVPARRYRSAGDPALVAEAAARLREAHRPLLHVGHGALWADASEEVRALAEALGAAVMTTMAGKSAFPEDHPLAAGAGGHTITRAAAHGLKHADLILGIGASFARGSFSSPIPRGVPLIQITVDERDIDRDYPVELAVIGDAKLVLRQLIDEIEHQGGGHAGRAAEVAAELKAVREAEWTEWGPRLTADEAPINPYRVIRELDQLVDKARTIITHDSGNPRDQTLPFYRALAPRGYLGWGKSTQLGTGLGLALGAKLAHPDKLCINIMGDLAFGTAAMDVETAVRERLPILTILLNNSRMGGYGHHMPVASERFGSNRLSGDYTAVATGLGAYSERVEAPGEVAEALRRAIRATEAGQPAVLEMITKEEPVYPSAPAVIAAVP